MQGHTTRFGDRRQSIPCLTQDEAALNAKGVGIMTHCRYCNRFRLTRLAGRGAWLLECGHTYLPLPSEAQMGCLDAGSPPGGLVIGA